ncbi:MAG: hypothetical protein GX293_13600 [Bacteroidales bacterium]|jgi:hypothetical protein|nr:hypothetical protein [Bacteroidales bacterium]OQC10711.1 MAG: hypothetical protein BWX75_00340 [Candidatus Cloacimonetes bacterium ADurb.Bin088]
MDNNELIQLIRDKQWDDVIENILSCDDNEVFKFALSQKDCPEIIILDLWQALDPDVRILVAKHPNTPMSVLKSMVHSDNDPKVRRIASKSYHMRRRSD